MTRFLAAMLLSFALLFAAGARADGAAPASGAYAATVPVADTSDAQRDAALSAALAQVLDRLAPQAKPGADVLGQAPGFVRTYNYQRATGGSGFQLQVEFDPGSIQHLVQQLGGSSAASAPANPGTATTAATQQAAGGSGTLWMSGITDSADFAAMLAALDQSTALHNVTPVAAQSDGVLLKLDYDSPLADIVTALTADGHMQPAPAHDGADIALRWSH